MFLGPYLARTINETNNLTYLWRHYGYGLFTIQQTVTDRKYALRSVSIRQRNRWLGKALVNRQDMPTVL